VKNFVWLFIIVIIIIFFFSTGGAREIEIADEPANLHAGDLKGHKSPSASIEEDKNRGGSEYSKSRSAAQVGVGSRYSSFECVGRCNSAWVGRSKNESNWMRLRGYPNPNSVGEGPIWSAAFDRLDGNVSLLGVAARVQDQLMLGDEYGAYEAVRHASKLCAPYPALLLSDYYEHEKKEKSKSLAFLKLASLLGDRRASSSYTIKVSQLPEQDIRSIEMRGYRIFEEMMGNTTLRCDFSDD
jgi:hypothetical protein